MDGRLHLVPESDQVVAQEREALSPAVRRDHSLPFGAVRATVEIAGRAAHWGAAPALRLTSQTFGEGGAIPDLHTCRGDDVSPALLWTGVPEGTAELAVVMRDLDADGFVHWVVAGLSPDLGGLAQDAVPGGAVEATNDLGRVGWSGPCPPEGTHHYEFRVFALAQASGVAQGEAGAEAAERIETAPALASAALSGTSTAPG